MSADPVACLREIREENERYRLYKSLEIERRRTSSVIIFARGMDKKKNNSVKCGW